MGTWDESSFGNDTACDWLYELENCEDISYIERTIQKILDAGDEYIDAEAAEEAIAAVEVLAWLRGYPPSVNAYTETLATWVAEHPIQPSPAILERALQAIERITSDYSELPDIWEGNKDWLAAIADLRTRLTYKWGESLRW